MRYIKQSATISVLLLVLCCCGQRGPLYLPKKPPAENQPTQSNATTQPSKNEMRGDW